MKTNRKKFLGFAIALGLMATPVIFTSCGDDEPDKVTETNNSNGNSNGNNGDSPSTSKVSDDDRIFGTWTGKVDGDNFKITFKSNGTYIEVTDYDTITTTFTLKNGKITLSDNTVLTNTISYPFAVSFQSSTSMTLGNVSFKKS